MCAVSSAARAHGSPHHHNEKDSSSFSPGSRLSNLVLDRAEGGSCWHSELWHFSRSLTQPYLETGVGSMRCVSGLLRHHAHHHDLQSSSGHCTWRRWWQQWLVTIDILYPFFQHNQSPGNIHPRAVIINVADLHQIHKRPIRNSNCSWTIQNINEAAVGPQSCL